MGTRLELYHGANNYLFMLGNCQYMDSEIFRAITKKQFIDTKNVQFELDIGRSYTWEIDNLMLSNLNTVRSIPFSSFINSK